MSSHRPGGLTAVIGAGPYGLSIAAHLQRRDLPVALFGQPMASWETMPGGMLLKSSWSASSLSDPDRAWSLDRYTAEAGQDRAEPIPLARFLDYTHWFAAHAAPPADTTPVARVSGEPGGFRLDLADGRTLDASRVVVATGIGSFAHIPDFAAGLPPHLASHTSQHRDFGALSGASVAVIGAGQSALESAALLHEAGAGVELIARGPVRWACRRLAGSWLGRLLYAPSDVGPAGISRVVDRPLAVRRLPTAWRRGLARRSVRPAGAVWLRERVEGVVRVTEGMPVFTASAAGDGVQLWLGDGTTRQVDHLLLGTGYRPDVRRLDLLARDLLARVETAGPLPRLNRWLESTIPGLHFAGALAEHDFGPICRFVAGAASAGRQVALRAAAA